MWYDVVPQDKRHGPQQFQQVGVLHDAIAHFHSMAT